MAIISKQIGWSQESNLLWQILKQLNRLTGVTSNIIGPQGPPGPSAGIFAQTADSISITGTTVESSLINGGVGTLSVPANGFAVGDSFSANLSGLMNAANNQTIRIRVKSGSVVFLDSGIQSLTNGIVDDVWTLNINFTIRQIGTASVASISSFGRFTYTKTTNASVQSFGMNTINNTTFDTTIDNTLDITVEWGSNNVANNIFSDIFILTKIY
jgi:hypothetical protein